jgi:hypothetical protein
LAATFTRQTVGSQRRTKPKFKSVANAIRTGIFFDKIYRRTQTVLAPIPLDFQRHLQKVNEWNFDCFKLHGNISLLGVYFASINV